MFQSFVCSNCVRFFSPHSHHKLDEVHRIQGEKFDLAHRKRLPLVQFDTQEGPCCYDMIAWRILCKIFERSDGLRGGLYLVEKYQRVALCAGHVRYSSDGGKYSGDIEVLLKEILKDLHLFEVHIRQLPVVLARKLLDQPSLANLSGPLYDKGFAIFFVLPFQKLVDGQSFHDPYL